MEMDCPACDNAGAGAGESLCRRLAGNESLAEAILSRAIDPWATHQSHGAPAADWEHGTAYQSKNTLPTERCADGSQAHLLAELVGVRVTAAEEQALLGRLMHPGDDLHVRAVTGCSKGACAVAWGEAVLAELVVQVPHAAGGSTGGWLGAGSLCSRSYVRQAAGETRLATVLVSDDS